MVVALLVLGTLGAANAATAAAAPRPVVAGATSDSAHFRVHYPPALAAHAGAALRGAEAAYARLVEGAGGPPNAGMRAPVDDGDGLTDIYFEDAPGEGGAWTIADALAPHASWISMDPAGPLVHTEKGAAHEVTHVVQHAYGSAPRTRERTRGWLTESTAAWAEELSTATPLVTNGLHDFRTPIDCTYGSWEGRSCGTGYGKWLFVAHLVQSVGIDVVRDAYERYESAYCPPRCDGGASGNDGLVHVDALEDVLASRGTSLAAEFREYAWKVLDVPAWAPYVERVLRAPGFPAAPPNGVVHAAVGASAPDTGWQNVSLDHLTARFALVGHAAGGTRAGDRVLLFAVTPRGIGAAPRVLVRPSTATVDRVPVAMRAVGGDAATTTWAVTLPFAAGNAVDAAIALVNDTPADDAAFAWRAVHVPAAAPVVPPRVVPPPVAGAALPPAEGDPRYRYPAKLRVSRAEIERSDRVLDVLAPITSRAEGEVDVELEAAGRTTSFTAPVQDADGAFDHIRFEKRIPAAQARLGTGILTIDYPGSATTRPQTVRLRAARNPARLDVDRIRLDGAGLDVAGSVSARASGIVRFEMSYQDATGAPRTWRARADIGEDGDWSLSDERVPPEVSVLGGYLSVLFTGDLEERMRGEMVSYRVSPGRTRTPE